MPNNAYQTAVRYILRRPHSEYELIIKLKRKGFDIDEINRALDNLKKEKHLDDARLAKDLVLWHNQNRPTGRFGIIQRLRKKGFKKEHIEAALDQELPAQIQEELLEKLAQKKLSKLERLYGSSQDQGSEAEQKVSAGRLREKLARFLLSRGFSNQEVLRQIEIIQSDEE